MKRVLLLPLCLLFIHTGHAQNDTAAIKALLEKEAASWRSGDVKEHAACWHIQPYSRILVSTPDGHCYDVLPDNVINPAPGQMGKGGSAQLLHCRYSISGNNAWVSHDEISTAADGTPSYSHEIRILEKIKGEWKLVGQSIHLYTP
ncbi:MAG: hypothetical protein U0U70_05400 [Chitinophagaceae bacterium]